MPKRGFTFVELLIAIAVIAIIMAIALPALIMSKRQANISVDVANLRQIGIAINIYSETQGDRAPLIETLVESSLVPTTMVTSPLDYTRRGISNEMIVRDGKPLPPYRISYSSLRHSTDLLVNQILESRGAGTVVSLAETNYDISLGFQPSGVTGFYFRLFTDGSVQRREIHREKTATGVVWQEHWLYTDDLAAFPVLGQS